MRPSRLSLPQQIGAWSRSDSVQSIDAETIFDYMNGAGELYLGYRFRYLDVTEYRAEGEYDILVEIYYMDSADDAFGLLSLDWSGERIFWRDDKGGRDQSAETSYPTALYGAGLLRLRAGPIYARIMAYRETPAAKQAILTLAEIITAGRPVSPAPALFDLMQAADDSPWQCERRHCHFLRSHLVLNSLYFLANINLLSLNTNVDAVLAMFYNREAADRPAAITALTIAYPAVDLAEKALAGFRQNYLSDLQPVAQRPSQNGTPVKLEEGWLGFLRRDQYLILILQGPDEEGTLAVLNLIDGNLKQGGIR